MGDRWIWLVLVPEQSKENEPYYLHAEDDSIVGDDGREVLGCSEWLRCDRENLEFMAHAKEDVEFLLNEIDKLNKLINDKEIKQKDTPSV